MNDWKNQASYLLNMYTSSLLRSGLFLFACLIFNLAIAQSAAGSTGQARVPQHPLGNDETTFVFAGHCSNGETYRLVSYKMDVNGLSLSFYNYEGPVGKGTVKTETAPKVMAARVCRKLAEIVNDNYWD